MVTVTPHMRNYCNGGSTDGLCAAKDTDGKPCIINVNGNCSRLPAPKNNDPDRGNIGLLSEWLKRNSKIERGA